MFRSASALVRVSLSTAMSTLKRSRQHDREIPTAHTLHIVCASLGIRPQNNLVVGFHLSMSEMMRLSINLYGFQDCSDAPNGGLIGRCYANRTHVYGFGDHRSTTKLSTHICRQGRIPRTVSADFSVLIKTPRLMHQLTASSVILTESLTSVPLRLDWQRR